MKQKFMQKKKKKNTFQDQLTTKDQSHSLPTNDTTNIEDRSKLQSKGSKGLATTTQLYTAKIRFSQLAKKPD